MVSGEPRLAVRADRTRCCGSGNCASILPEMFDQDDEGLVVVREPYPDAGLRSAVDQAVLLCPVQAIEASPAEPVDARFRFGG
ncbi:MAG: ferredoxin [Catenulispora sp.]|nr:ferredoxin [Catenulispora sp.]